MRNEMLKFSLRSLARLKRMVHGAGIDGDWVRYDHRHQFHAEGGGILIYYPITKTITFRGPHQQKEELERRVRSLLSKPPEPYLEPPYCDSIHGIWLLD